MPPSDADLIAASRAGDTAAYDTLYRRPVSAAHDLARQLARGRPEADDVVAETFVKILDLLHRGGGPDDAFRPYLPALPRLRCAVAPCRASADPCRGSNATSRAQPPTAAPLPVCATRQKRSVVYLARK